MCDGTHALQALLPFFRTAKPYCLLIFLNCSYYIKFTLNHSLSICSQHGLMTVLSAGHRLCMPFFRTTGIMVSSRLHMLLLEVVHLTAAVLCSLLGLLALQQSRPSSAFAKWFVVTVFYVTALAVYYDYLMPVILAILLIIGGVESNPGPAINILTIVAMMVTSPRPTRFRQLASGHSSALFSSITTSSASSASSFSQGRLDV